MKRFILPLLTIIVLLGTELSAEAATAIKELAAGTKSATLTFTIKEKQSFEGTISTKSAKAGKIEIKSVKASTNNSKNTVECVTEGNKIYMISDGTAVTTTVNVQVSFTDDGAYQITLAGGSTDKEGIYKAKTINEVIKVTVGEAEEEEDDEEETEESDMTATDQTTENTNVKKENQEATTDLKKEKITTTVRKPEKLEKSEEELSEQRVIDEIIEKAEEKMKEVEEETKKELTGTPKSMDSLFNYLKNFWFVFLILFIVLLVCMYLLWKLLRKNTKSDYDGAPMVDYHIEDDD